MEHNGRVKNIINRLLKRYPEIIKVGDNPVALQIPIDKVIKPNQVKGGSVEASGSSGSSGSDSDIEVNTQPDEPDKHDSPAESGEVERKKSQDLSTKDSKSDTKLKQQHKSKHGSAKASDSSDSSGSGSRSKNMYINRKKHNKYFKTSTGNTVENQNRYVCPSPNCDYSDADPSRITEHIEEVHSKGIGSGSSDGGLD